MNFCFCCGDYYDAYGVPFVVARHKEDILPLAETAFEGHMLPVPHNADKILRDQYGDYMSLPNLDNISSHTSKIEMDD